MKLFTMSANIWFCLSMILEYSSSINDLDVEHHRCIP